SSARSTLGALLALARLGAPRIVPFRRAVRAARREPTPVRIRVLKRLRSGHRLPGDRPAVAEAILRVVSDRCGPDLRLQAVLALAEFTDAEGVPTALGALALDPNEPIDLRYAAFTSLQRAGPTAA